MRKGFLGSLAVLAAGAGLTFGQQFNPPPGPLPGTLPPQGEITGYPPPGVAPGACERTVPETATAKQAAAASTAQRGW